MPDVKYVGSFQLIHHAQFAIQYPISVICLQIQGQIYHLTGSLMPTPDSDYPCLQIYFDGRFNETSRSALRTQHFGEKTDRGTTPNVFPSTQRIGCIIHDRVPSDDRKIVIKAHKTAAGQHARRFNALTIDEVAIVVAGEMSENTVVLHRR